MMNRTNFGAHCTPMLQWVKCFRYILIDFPYLHPQNSEQESEFIRQVDSD
ncbi:hypothetical protein VC0101557_12640 [Vibrio cholerae VC0101557]|uniref:Uncharacterized protein n=1 Tax=Vibrio cholerae serotype O1 (strain ATCC 39541 / Classical Ogawa 395 / O395) TaxID=345073 RepID=A0A0H3ALX5_VIBC3|nr:hypothetical protein [Vibrio cholerae]ABQ21852.1 hypothetical protein VC0395_A0155 [Vibrio cholerae O395]AEA77837.1 hypothetical protein VCLMA_A0547 [Vibrio cholerae LMA3984-4]AET25651.1 conserved hypothetical protein [Vibrio cholerae O1 str. 2010EL-1786]ALJ64959.1 hypothetical protein N900_11475 [Vibrio cholerae O1 str. KW3]EAZ73124.1 hypothetical protein A5C_0644 [Vibrio cholerae NCTC 8457]EAZ76719.1 hypothetical protein A5E_0690 [Vibrio cholerae B33]EEO07146.1 hypothetical protein VIF_